MEFTPGKFYQDSDGDVWQEVASGIFSFVDNGTEDNEITAFDLQTRDSLGSLIRVYPSWSTER